MKKLFLPLALLLFTSCKQKAIESTDITPLVFDTICTDTTIGYPLEISATDSVILISDCFGDSLVHSFNLETRTIQNLVPYGSGPGEVISPITVQPYHDSIYVYSRPIQKMFRGTVATNPLTEIGIAPGATSNIWKITDNEYIASTIIFGNDEIDKAVKQRFLLLDNNLQPKYEFGSFPNFWSKENKYDNAILSNFHQTLKIIPLSENHLAAITHHIVSFYNRDNDSTQFSLNKEILIVPYEYDVKEPTNITSAQTHRKESFTTIITDAQAYNDSIILELNDTRDDSDSSYTSFLCLNKDGQITHRYNTDSNIRSPFCITKTGHIIMVNSNNNASEIIQSSTPIDI